MSARLRIENLSWHVDDSRDPRSRAVLSGVSLEVRPGDLAVVMGRNGAGKSTLLDIVAGLRRPSGGVVKLDDRPADGWDPRARARLVAHLPQAVRPDLPFLAGELVLMGRYPHDPGRYFESPRDRAVAHDAMEATSVLELADMPIEHLSGGERQRAVIARALAQEPQLLVLDEPTAHLDLRHQVEAAALLRRLNRGRGMTVLLVSHDLNLAAEVCDRLLLLNGGQPTVIGPPDVVLDEALLASVFGCAVVVDKNDATGRPIVRLTWRTDSAEVTSTER